MLGLHETKIESTIKLPRHRVGGFQGSGLEESQLVRPPGDEDAAYNDEGYSN